MFALYIVLYVQWCASLRMHEDARRVVRGVWLQREQPTYYRDVECIYTARIVVQQYFYTVVASTSTHDSYSESAYKTCHMHFFKKTNMHKYMQLHPQWLTTGTYNIIYYTHT